MTRLRAETERLQVPLAEADDLRDQLEEQKSKVKNMWRVNCEQISMYHTECCDKDSVLRARVVELEATGAAVHSAEVRGASTPVHDTLSARMARDDTSPRSSIVHPLRVLERPTQKVGRRGKLYQSTPFRQRTLRIGSRTGYQHWREQHSGTDGLMTSPTGWPLTW